MSRPSLNSGVAQSIYPLATGWTFRGSNPGGSQIFRARPGRPWCTPSLLVKGHWVSFPGVKRPGRGVHHPPPSNADAKGRVKLYLYSPFGSSWPVLGRILPSPSLKVLVIDRPTRDYRGRIRWMCSNVGLVVRFFYVQSNQKYFLQLRIPLRYCTLRDSNVNELFIKLAVN
jgi:hypothetical protein